jgi:hypothetical protein
MRIFLRLLAVAVCLSAWRPLVASILYVDADRILTQSPKTSPGELSMHKSTSAYQSEILADVGRWFSSKEVDTFGPLAIGLILLLLPIGFAAPKPSSRTDVQPPAAEDNNLRRIGRSWDPRF